MENITMVEGLKFRSKHFKGLCMVVKVDEPNNMLDVHINPENPNLQERTEDMWNLQHVKYGFENGDYFEE